MSQWAYLKGNLHHKGVLLREIWRRPLSTPSLLASVSSSTSFLASIWFRRAKHPILFNLKPPSAPPTAHLDWFPRSHTPTTATATFPSRRPSPPIKKQLTPSWPA